MLSYREDYLKAGLLIFPVTNPIKVSVKLIFILSLLLTIVSTSLYLTAKLTAISLASLTLLNILLLYGSWQLMFQQDKKASWRLYKLCTYPYLGLTFTLFSLSLWL
jgi:heme O synthase-like polyprenyltransferase